MLSSLLLGVAVPLTPAAEPRFPPRGNWRAEEGKLAFESVPHARYDFRGLLGQRIDANVENWLLRAPQANPGILDMFRLRDRKPEPNLVPWAGEFIGKYLLSAIPVLRMKDAPELPELLSQLVRDLIATQAEDGYLGPFPTPTRLQGNWDLWGHYHVLQALLLWHEETGDAAALAAARRAADLICRTYLDQPRRVFDAGSQEMNMAILHGFGHLYRLTGDTRYLRLMREIEKDWERAGDYLRTGLAGMEFFQTPRPRWESLHDLQGLLELHRITGDPRYREAFEHHWRSLARWDRHNTGGFSSGEQATGNPYSSGPIETCGTVAWLALTADMLRLTGSASVADELELSTFNAGAGAQHPSGRWWTYNTPMNGLREASAHAIVFQARADTPELNCCAVNGPRVLALLPEWAVMRTADGLAVNYYGPGRFQGQLPDGTSVTLRQETRYPLSGQVRLWVEPAEPRRFSLRLRVPGWSKPSEARINQVALKQLRAGRYFESTRRWQKGDLVELNIDMGLRVVPGDREARGKVSLYRGPLLLAFDQKYNALDKDALPPLDLARLSDAKVLSEVSAEDLRGDPLKPWLLIELPARNGRTIRLSDFASAGATGTRYRSWLAAEPDPPPPVFTRSPPDGATIPIQSSWFAWTGPAKTNATVTEYRLSVGDTPDLGVPLVEVPGIGQNRYALDEPLKRRLPSQRWCYWRVVTVNANGRTENVGPPARFRIDPSLAPTADAGSEGVRKGPDRLLVRALLQGKTQTEFGRLKRSIGFKPAPGPDGQPNHAVQLDGKTQMLSFELEEWPETDYSAALWIRMTKPPEKRVRQIVSAWAGPMDDPLRLCVEDGKLFARLEAQQAYSTEGVPVEPGRWYHCAVVKEGTQLRLYVDGALASSTAVPGVVWSSAQDFALGGNPHFSGDEFLAARFCQFTFYGRALTGPEIATLAAQFAK